MKPRLVLLLASVMAGASVCWADPTLPALFSDHMVVQQGREIRIWGKADPAERVTVSLAGRSASTKSDKGGGWSVRLPAMHAGGPFTLTVQGKRQIVVKDVMIGEVWVASGQSNMAFGLSGAEGAATEVPRADYSGIRLFNVPKKIAVSPQEDVQPAAWQICTPDTAKNFSAVAYFFARKLHQTLNVPIGVIESAWPGTTIQEWIDSDSLRADASLVSVFDEWNRASAPARNFAEQPLAFRLEFDDFELIPASQGPAKMLANFEDGTARLSLGGSLSYSWSETPGSRFELITPGHSGAGYAARVGGDLDGAQDSILTATYKQDHSPVDLTQYSGIRFWVRGSGSFRFRSLQPTITDFDDYATPMLQATADWQPVTVWFHDLRQDGWGVVLPFTQNELSGFSIEALTTLGYPPMPVSALYNGMITPLLPYAWRGVIWYQGESNALKAQQYRKLLPMLIQNWRAASHQPDMDFLIVQLPNHGAIPAEPGESAWAELREAQFQTVQHVAHSGMAVTIDVGDPKDLHPHRKREVGERLALWALGTTYAEPVAYSGPLYQSMEIEGSQIRIHFTHIRAGLKAQGEGKLQGFAIAGVDRKFHWADARIDGDTVVVSSAVVANPVAVRYAWADSPTCNLFNLDGLPASPFRTDDWPGITEGH